jgi:biotin-(acetyl-CoA carboxylase) ligase
MNQIQHLECEIQEYKIELEKHEKSIQTLHRSIDNAKIKLDELKRKETLEKYKPQLEGYVDKYIDKKQVEYPYDSTKILLTKTTHHKDFDEILQLLKSIKEKGNLIYLYAIWEPILVGGRHALSYAAFKPE